MAKPPPTRKPTKRQALRRVMEILERLDPWDACSIAGTLSNHYGVKALGYHQPWPPHLLRGRTLPMPTTSSHTQPDTHLTRRCVYCGSPGAISDRRCRRCNGLGRCGCGAIAHTLTPSGESLCHECHDGLSQTGALQ